MEKLPKRFVERVAKSLKQYQHITEAQRKRDVSEADTVTVVKDILADIFGYDKYAELTSEHQIRGTFCDLAIRVDGKIRFLVEVKAAALDLNDNHLRQALNYGANQGIEWLVLTNGVDWQLHKVIFGQPIDKEEVARFNLGAISAQRQDDLQILYLLAREGTSGDVLNSFHQRSQLVNKFMVAQYVLSEGVSALIRRDLRRHFPDLKVSPEQIQELLCNEVLKREVLEGDKVKEAQSRIKRAANKLAKQAEKDAAVVSAGDTASE
ncbi:type I restriction enzyme HsdR N-terminal domain-containing protein [Aestuariivirga sp.]|uniref:type I restriction enzyme HsdR N-terminal domain-containing protein n=1 Tax=Aestuariivirga sp. TaxID=2650926 RepID=UPI003BA86544